MPCDIEKLETTLRDNILPSFVFRWRAAINRVPDAQLYRPTFQPWLRPEFRRFMTRSTGTPCSARSVRGWFIRSRDRG